MRVSFGFISDARGKDTAMTAKNNIDQIYMRRSQAAKYLSVSIRTLANFQASKVIPYSKVGKSVIFSKHDLDEFVSKFRVNAIGEK